jgi:glycosyltransferase involved in cell wall biosynthesis
MEKITREGIVLTETPIRVLQVMGTMNRGGAETMIMNIYRKIDKSRVQFDFLLHTDKPCDYDDEIISLGGSIFRIPKLKVINWHTYTTAVKRFFRLHSEYNIVECHIEAFAAVLIGIAKASGIATIAHSHNTKRRPLNPANIVFEMSTFPTRRTAHYFFGCSVAAGIDRFGHKTVRSDRYKTLNNAIPSEQFAYSGEIRERIRTEFDLSDAFVIGHVGRFAHQKNHEYIIDIFDEINKRNHGTVLVLVGRGELEEKIQSKVKRLNLSDRVIFAGVRPDVNDLLQAMDTFLFPSLYEGLGVAAVEAQAAGLPCFIADTIPEEVIITPLVKRLSTKAPPGLWADEILNHEYGVRTDTRRMIIDAGYDVETTAAQLLDFYERIATDSTKGLA